LDSGITTANSKKLPLKLAINNEPLVEKTNKEEIKLLKNIEMQQTMQSNKRFN